MKLDIGAGTEKQAGWSTLDVNPESDADFIDDATTLETIPDGSCDEIRAVHMIEHLYHFQVIPTLELWYRKLKPAGILTLYIPDVITEMERFLLRDSNPERFFCIVYGKQWTETPSALHKTAFWPERIEQLLSAAKFRHVRSIPARYDTEFALTARKPQVRYIAEET